MDHIRGGKADPSSRDRLPSLTGLRFWAALLVVLYHLSRQVGTVPVISDVAWYGRSGVTFFFVLSGFVLAWTYDSQKVPARVFLWRRFARIWPMLAVSVTASVAAWYAIGTAVSWRGTAATVLLLNAWVPEQQYMTGGNPAAWSLSAEAWFYAIFPVLLALPLLRTARRRLWVAVAVCALSLAAWLAGPLIGELLVRRWALDYFPPTRTLQFVLGMAAGLAVKRGWRSPIGLIPSLALVVVWHAALVPWSRAVPDSAWYSPYSASQLLSAPLFAALVVAAAQSDVARRATGLGSPWMTRLGHWSFAWYLIHEIVIRLLRHATGDPGSTAGTAAFWAAALTISLALAGLAYQFVEHPLERLLRRIGPRPPVPPSVADDSGIPPVAVPSARA